MIPNTVKNCKMMPEIKVMVCIATPSYVGNFTKKNFKKRKFITKIKLYHINGICFIQVILIFFHLCKLEVIFFSFTC